MKLRELFVRIAVASVAVVISLVLTSCPQSFTQEIVETVDDRITPTIQIMSPANDDEYQASITVTGTVHDSSLTDGDGLGDVTVITFEIANTSVSAGWAADGSADSIIFDPVSGEFSLTVDTADLTSRSITLNIAARDANSNVAMQTVSMIRTEGPTFTDFEIFDPPGATSFTVLGPLGIRGTLTNSALDIENTDNITALSWRRGSWSAEIDFTATLDADGWYEVENVGTGGTGNRGYFRYNTTDGTVEITIPRISGVDPADRLEFQLEATDRNENTNAYVYSVFGLEAPGGEVVINPDGLYYSSTASVQSPIDIQIEAFNEAEKDRITTIGYWFNSDTTNLVSLTVDTANDWEFITLPGNTDPSWVYTITLDPASTETADEEFFDGNYGETVNMNIELIDDELPGSPRSTATTIVNDTTAPAVSNVTIVSGNGLPGYAMEGDGVTLEFTLTDAQAGVSSDPVVTILGHGITPTQQSGDENSGVWRATYTIDGTDFATTYGGQPLAAFTIDATDDVGNDATQYDYVDLDGDGTNLRFYKGNATISGISVASSNSLPTWAIQGETLTIDFAEDEDRDAAMGSPVVTLWPGTGDARALSGAGITDNGPDYTAVFTMGAGDPQGAIPYRIDFIDAAGNGGASGPTATGIVYDRTPPSSQAPDSVVTVGAPVVPDWWNGDNTDVTVTTTIPNDGAADYQTLAGGSLQIQALATGGSGYADIGSSESIEVGEIGTAIPITLPDDQITDLDNYGEGDTLSFRAVLTDAAGNSTAGPASGTTLTVDTMDPLEPGVDIDLATINIPQNTAGTALTVSGEIGAQYEIVLTNAVQTSDSDPGPFAGTIGGGGSVSLTISAVATGEVTAEATLTDAAGNVSTTGSDTAFAALEQPDPPVVSAVTATGGTVRADWWNGTNTGVAVTVAIENEPALDGGSVQVRICDASDGSFVDIGDPVAIDTGDLGGSIGVPLTEGQIEGYGGYAQGATLYFRAVITDRTGNASDEGSTAGDTLEVDTSAPANPTVTIVPDTVNIDDNGGGTAATVAGEVNATYTVVLTNANRISGDLLTGTIDGDGNVVPVVQAAATGDAIVEATITDQAGNPAAGSGSDSFYAALTAPDTPVVSTVTVTGGTVVTGATDYWNSTNTGIDVIVPIPNDVPLDGGSVQIQARGGASAYTDVGTAHPIDLSGGAYDATVSLNEATVEAINGYAQGATLSFRAVIVDQYGNDTTGSAGADTIEVDTSAPSGYGVTIDTDPINNGNEDDVDFTISSAEDGAGYDYTFSSSGGGIDVTGSGTIFGTSETVTGVDLSGLGDGTITLSVTLTDVAGNTGTPAAEDTADMDTTLVGVDTVGYTDADTGIANDLITWNHAAADQEGPDWVTYYILAAHVDSTQTTIATVQSTYTDRASLEADIGAPDRKVIKVVASGVDGANSTTFGATGLVNYAFVNNSVPGSSVSLATTDVIQLFIVTIDTAENMDVAVTSSNQTLASITTSGSSPRTAPTGLSPIGDGDTDDYGAFLGGLFGSSRSRRSRDGSSPTGGDEPPEASSTGAASNPTKGSGDPSAPAVVLPTTRTAPAPERGRTPDARGTIGTTAASVDLVAPAIAEPSGENVAANDYDAYATADPPVESAVTAGPPPGTTAGAIGAITPGEGSAQEEGAALDRYGSADRRTLAALALFAVVALLGTGISLALHRSRRAGD